MRTKNSGKKRSGQALIMITLSLIPMFGLLGLVVDVGWMEFIKKQAQTAADAAAMAALLQFQSTTFSSSFACGTNGVVCQAPTSCSPAPSNYLNSGCLYAQLNGFTSSGNQYVTIQAGVGVPPTAAGVNSSAYWVTVRVNQSVPQLFSAVLGNSSGLVSARATAALSPARDCIYVMDPTGSGALLMSGTPNLVTSCGVYINSTSPTALDGSGTPTLRASEIDIVGNYTFSGTLDPNPPSTNVAPMNDPFASLPAPTVPAGCDYTNYQANGNRTLSPGVYCGGIDINNSDATMNPGTYILKGGGLTTQSANSHLTGSGVTIYNTYDATHSYAPLNINANSTVSLTAPTTGTYAGVLIMEDRRITAGSYTDSFGGGSSQQYTGIIYAPKSNMNYSGNASSSAYTILVSYRLNMVGTSTINNNYSSLPTGNPIKVTALVE
jgi:hypothetical protein